MKPEQIEVFFIVSSVINDVLDLADEDLVKFPNVNSIVETEGRYGYQGFADLALAITLEFMDRGLPEEDVADEVRQFAYKVISEGRVNDLSFITNAPWVVVRYDEDDTVWCMSVILKGARFEERLKDAIGLPIKDVSTTSEGHTFCVIDGDEERRIDLIKTQTY